jgi:hypothetical protein
MLDWTTSFLSDAIIIKPEITVCQTLSLDIRPVERSGAETTTCGVLAQETKKEPRSYPSARLLTKTGGNSPTPPKINPTGLSLVQFASQR